MASPLLKPGQKLLRTYYETRDLYSLHNVEHESAIRHAFLTLLADSARLRNWVVIQELSLKISGRQIRPDAVVQDDYHLYRGYCEAKDTLRGIPPETFDYRLGHRSALEWIVDQYQLKRDDSGRVVSDPNRTDDPEYILRPIGQVIAVSLETNRLVAGLAQLPFRPS